MTNTSLAAAGLLAEIEQFLAATRTSATGFGKSAVNDDHFVHDLRGGRAVTAQVESRVREFMDEERRRLAAFLREDVGARAEPERAA